jgi:urease accessory protein
VDAVANRHGTVPLQRASGQLAVSVKSRGPHSVLDGLRQVGCLKARFPRPDDSAWRQVVTLNTSGGIAGGDILDATFAVGEGARATIASQAAERFYRALPDSAPSSVTTRIAVAACGAAEWLPQETILFDRCAVRRHLRIELAADAWFLGVECLVFGRAAMGEVVEQGSLRDVIEVWRGGRLLLHDAVRLGGAIAALLQRPAIADDARAIATIVHVAPDAEGTLDAVRGASPQCGASAWDGMLMVRVLATDGASLRSAVITVLKVLRAGRALPRVWLC